MTDKLKLEQFTGLRVAQLAPVTGMVTISSAAYIDLYERSRQTHTASAPIPPDATTEEWKDAVWKVWKLARVHDNSIPSHWLDAMRVSLIEAGKEKP